MAEKFIPSEKTMNSGKAMMGRNAISISGKASRIKANNKIFAEKSFMYNQY
jgi:hypothetical protein